MYIINNLMNTQTKSIDMLLAEMRYTVKNKRELEYFLIHQDRFRQILERIQSLELPSGARILDIGCYPPYMYDVLSALGYRMSGISSKHEPMRNKDISVVNIETDVLSYKAHYFDLLLFSEVMEHLVVSPLVYLEKFRKVLKPSGILLITTPNASGLHKRIPALFGRSTYFPLSELYDTHHGDGSLYHRHNREYTRNELQEVLSNAMFTIRRSEYIAVYGPFRERIAKRSVVQRLIRACAFFLTVVYKPFRDTLYIEAQPASGKYNK